MFPIRIQKEEKKQKKISKDKLMKTKNDGCHL